MLFFRYTQLHQLAYTKMDYKNLSLIELSALIKNGKTTHTEVYNYFLERTKQYNAELNAFNTLPGENPIFSQPDSLPIAIKDIFCETGVRTTASSKMLENFIPPYESTVTESMKRSGFVSFGKTNMDEFAMG
jgi:aspartyl-tRNA(Asn)/glutamyl-tRNA(Gln) amidotransferase subunit A